MGKDIIEKLKESNLKGRGGAGFPTGLKWEIVKKEKASKKYIICNASEGDPTVSKDKYILGKYPEEVVEGIKIALQTIDNSSAFIYLRKDYLKKFRKKLEQSTKGLPIILFKKPGGYLAGEETALLEGIEGKRPEPRLKPPFPSQKGLWGYPTLINNVETFYSVAQIAKGKYRKTRFYYLSGEARSPGVFELDENLSIKNILEKTENWPDFNFFVLAGGILGNILLPEELNQPLQGIGSIVVYNFQKTDAISLMRQLINFALKENCDRCTPCREGLYRISEILEKKKINEEIFNDIFFVLKETSLCPLGKIVPYPLIGLISKIYAKENKD